MKIKIKSVFKILLLCVPIIAFCATPTKAQQSEQDLQDLQQIVAIVNDEVISLYDLKQRTRLLFLSNPSRNVTPEQEQNLQNQAMNGLIDDKLKLQEAKKFEAVATTNELEDAFANYARQFNLTSEELVNALKEAGIEKQTLVNQISGTLAWQRVVGGLLSPLVNITDDEVMNFLDKLERDKGKFEYNVSEIFLLITNNAQRDEVVSSANLIHKQLEDGTPFTAIAQQFSQSSTASVGGDMGWVMDNELPKEVSSQLPNMNVGEISDPIITEDGVYILKLTNKRKILTLNDEDIAVTLKFLYFMKDDFPDKSFDDLNKLVLSKVKNTNACEANKENAVSLKATGDGDIGTTKVGNLPREAREEILNLEIGQGTKLYEEENGYRSYILCAKDIPEVKLPEFDTVLDNMTQSRLQLVARRHLRDLRRDAIVDYR
ncbi:MAG: peptidylprolyl isomerase [Alphaproteobacteria bacterium]|nr:peptidylprolyl isomerase [Alphaproteobacteria bacterium]HPF46952.1 peptidylprolyl isomerase [Emcibacteraceae bacterium]